MKQVKSVNARCGENSDAVEYLINKWIHNQHTVPISLSIFQLQSWHIASKNNSCAKYNNKPLTSSWNYQYKVETCVIRGCLNAAFGLWYLGQQRHIDEVKTHNTIFRNFIMVLPSPSGQKTMKKHKEEIDKDRFYVVFIEHICF